MSRRKSWVIATLACIIALGFGNRGFGQAHDEDHAMSPFEGLTKLYKYPDGSKEIEEKLSRPAQNIEAVENVETLLRSPTGVNAEAAADDAAALKPYLRSSAQMPISTARRRGSGCGMRPSIRTATPTRRRNFRRRRASKWSPTRRARSKGRLSSRSGTCRAGKELNGLDVAQARRKLEEERGGLKDQLEQIGVGSRVETTKTPASRRTSTSTGRTTPHAWRSGSSRTGRLGSSGRTSSSPTT